MKKRLLIIEDDERLVRSLMRCFELEEGWELSAALTLEEGLKMVEKLRPDVLLLDMNLGKSPTDGLQGLRKLRSDPRFCALPVLILTGRSVEVADRVRGLEDGADDYIRKPVSPAALLARVEAAFARARPPAPKAP